MKEDTFAQNLSAEKLMQARERNPSAQNSYVVFFTPRSGSSWLTDICEKTGRLSRPDECFNPQFMPEMTRALGARDISEYIELLRRRRNTGGLYGCQLTYHQLNAVFQNEDEFMTYFHEAKYVWLIRKDIVAQAISLAKMVATSITHAPSASDDEIANSDRRFDYNRAVIKHWLNHILYAEDKTELLFDKYRIEPLRVSYEGLTALGVNSTVRLVAKNVGAVIPEGKIIESKHRKIATEVNDIYAERFRAEEADFLTSIYRHRSLLLEKCSY